MKLQKSFCENNNVCVKTILLLLKKQEKRPNIAITGTFDFQGKKHFCRYDLTQEDISAEKSGGMMMGCERGGGGDKVSINSAHTISSINIPKNIDLNIFTGSLL